MPKMRTNCLVFCPNEKRPYCNLLWVLFRAPQLVTIARLVGARGNQTFHLSKPVVVQNMALHAVPADGASAYLVSAFPAHSTSFSPNLSTDPQR